MKKNTGLKFRDLFWVPVVFGFLFQSASSFADSDFIRISGVLDGILSTIAATSSTIHNGQEQCFDPRPYQLWVNQYLQDRDSVHPLLTSLCVTRTSVNLGTSEGGFGVEYSFRWTFGPTPRSIAWSHTSSHVPDEQDYWEIFFPQLGSPQASQTSQGLQSGTTTLISTEVPQLTTDVPNPVSLRSLSLERKGSVRFYRDSKQISVKFKGIGFNLTQLTIAGFSIPDDLLHFSIDSITVHDGGAIEVAAGAPIFGIPIDVKGQISAAQGIELREVSFFGLKWEWVQLLPKL